MPLLVNTHAIAFDDILLVPQYSTIDSRLNTNITTRLSRRIELAHPIVSTNMSTVTDANMIVEMSKTGGAGILHRFMSDSQVSAELEFLNCKNIYPIVISVGVKPEDYNRVDLVMDVDFLARPHAILVDIAHGDSLAVVKMLSYIKRNYEEVDVIAGNIATRNGARRLIEAGADALRVGIGGGSVCSTRTVTGHGVPTLQSIIDVAAISTVPIIGDGGFCTSGDIVKALAFGADTVSLGGLLGATLEAAGETVYVDGVAYKRMFGMSSREAQERLRSGLKAGTAPEGISKLVPCTGNTVDVVNELLGGIRSGLTYSGAEDIVELRDRAEYVLLGSGGSVESKH